MGSKRKKEPVQLPLFPDEARPLEETLGVGVGDPAPPPCTCGSGAHPRPCVEHPEAYAKHIASLEDHVQYAMKCATYRTPEECLRHDVEAGIHSIHCAALNQWVVFYYERLE
jgi:hypothetical protein